MHDNKKNRSDFANILWGLAEDFGGNISENGVNMRFDALKEYELKDIRVAGTWLLKNREEKFPPVPTTREIISAIEKITGNLESRTVAGIQADIVFKKLRQWGKEAQPKFLNKTTLYLMTHRWSFLQLGGMNPKELEWFRKNFIDSFLEMNKQEVAPLIEESIKKKLPNFEMKKIEDK